MLSNYFAALSSEASKAVTAYPNKVTVKARGQQLILN
jgi:hypothetical protein